MIVRFSDSLEILGLRCRCEALYDDMTHEGGRDD